MQPKSTEKNMFSAAKNAPKGTNRRKGKPNKLTYEYQLGVFAISKKLDGDIDDLLEMVQWNSERSRG
jgi:hypothetical protein